jgi:hypothetical protein
MGVVEPAGAGAVRGTNGPAGFPVGLKAVVGTETGWAPGFVGAYSRNSMTAVVLRTVVVTDTVFDWAVIMLPAKPLEYVAFALLLMTVPDGVSDQPGEEKR